MPLMLAQAGIFFFDALTSLTQPTSEDVSIGMYSLPWWFSIVLGIGKSSSCGLPVSRCLGCGNMAATTSPRSKLQENVDNSMSVAWLQRFLMQHSCCRLCACGRIGGGHRIHDNCHCCSADQYHSPPEQSYSFVAVMAHVCWGGSQHFLRFM